MRRIGIREARQNLSPYLAEVASGSEVVITDRGRPVARIVPYRTDANRPFPSQARFRQSLPRLVPALSASVLAERGDRLE